MDFSSDEESEDVLQSSQSLSSSWSTLKRNLPTLDDKAIMQKTLEKVNNCIQVFEVILAETSDALMLDDGETECLTRYLFKTILETRHEGMKVRDAFQDYLNLVQNKTVAGLVCHYGSKDLQHVLVYLQKLYDKCSECKALLYGFKEKGEQVCREYAETISKCRKIENNASRRSRFLIGRSVTVGITLTVIAIGLAVLAFTVLTGGLAMAAGGVAVAATIISASCLTMDQINIHRFREIASSYKVTVEELELCNTEFEKSVKLFFEDVCVGISNEDMKLSDAIVNVKMQMRMSSSSSEEGFKQLLQTGELQHLNSVFARDNIERDLPQDGENIGLTLPLNFQLPK